MSIMNSLFGQDNTFAAEQARREDLYIKLSQQNVSSNANVIGGWGGNTTSIADGSQHQNVFLNTSSTSRAEEMTRRIAALNANPAYVVSLREGALLFAARWGSEWVDVGNTVTSYPGEMSWLQLATRLLKAGRMEEANGFYRIIES
jgi:hypothetical protein